MKYTIDRFEGEYAVIEDKNKKMFNISKEILPADAKEGDIITIEIDYDATNERKKRITKMMNDLWE